MREQASIESKVDKRKEEDKREHYKKTLISLQTDIDLWKGNLLNLLNNSSTVDEFTKSLNELQGFNDTINYLSDEGLPKGYRDADIMLQKSLDHLDNAFIEIKLLYEERMSDNVNIEFITTKLNNAMPELEEVKIYVDLALEEVYEIEK